MIHKMNYHIAPVLSKDTMKLVDTMKSIGTMTLVDIFDEADTNQDGWTTHCEGSSSALRDIAHTVHADVNDDEMKPDNCKHF
ncbi:hypothetical protein B9Z55_028336 [Caenorhabditis nigoni]|uniref:Uncharacterized protein n=1 Tax=Caenorhabditis nigoni TaxID=1611254 RepID=A0A2G5SBY2_9PELO|nr:hypothetical protein B9Z55_028334 [Caenorhabditis nigoni]PIC12564.1 hypothetical protein B9Z55_028336 [Caenorhabditis nigoni]